MGNQKRFNRSQDTGMYIYTVACAGIFHTLTAYIRLRGNGRQDNAVSLARAQHGGYLSYHVHATDKE